MDSILAFALFAVGLVVIIKGGDWFVESAVSIAKKTGIPSIVKGATIVRFPPPCRSCRYRPWPWWTVFRMLPWEI